VGKGAWNGNAATQPIRQQEHVRLREKMGHVESALGQFRIGGVAGVPELGIGMQLVKLGQRDDRVHVLGRLVTWLVGGEPQGECGTSLEGQLDRMIEVTVEGLQDEERVIHDE